jgi:hypothetical protein
MNSKNEQTADSIIELFKTIDQKDKAYFGMGLIANIALEASAGNPIMAVGIIENAKLDLRETLNEVPEDAFESFVN